MPRIHLTYQTTVLSQKWALHIAKLLPKIAVDTLSITGNEEASFKEKDVDVRLVPCDDTNSVNMGPLSITVDANYFPERQENINDRTTSFAQKIEELLKQEKIEFAGGSIGSVWIRLTPAGYTPFTLPEAQL